MTSTSAADPLTMPVAPAARELPRAGTVLVVTARPGQESSDLGGLLYAFRRAGASLALLCLTRGEASPLNSTWCARLEAIRPWELQLAANVLGISEVTVASNPDGELRRHPAADLTQRVRHAIRRYSADLLLVIAPEAGDPDDAAVAVAACAAARHAGIPVAARAEPGARGGWMIDLGADAATARAIQKSAAAAHQSQSQALPELIRRLDLLDGREALRWLVPPPPRQSTTRRSRRRPGNTTHFAAPVPPGKAGVGVTALSEGIASRTLPSRRFARQVDQVDVMARNPRLVMSAHGLCLGPWRRSRTSPGVSGGLADSKNGAMARPLRNRPCAVTSGIPTPSAELGLDAVLSRATWTGPGPLLRKEGQRRRRDIEPRNSAPSARRPAAAGRAARPPAAPTWRRRCAGVRGVPLPCAPRSPVSAWLSASGRDGLRRRQVWPAISIWLPSDGHARCTRAGCH